ncbi:MAG TPA: dipeptide/oligopeptide/nickel ABC transporter ATP-binding protein [Methanolinea sp.]|nr:dipeptide/oligopeptide/nickel ABC transporter ATP-binding protein [Methanolinea sp.]
MPPELLSVEGLHKTYGHGDIFSDVTFTLRGGETIGLFGMSGSGKSTLSRCILGLERPTHGKIRFEGLEITRMRRSFFSGIKPLIQMIFQHPEVSFNPRMKLIDSVTEPLVYHKKISVEDVFTMLMPLIEAVGLKKEQFFRYPHQLSGGEIQRAMLVRIYSLEPKLVIADEPTSMLDMSVQAQVLTLIRTLQQKNQNACIFISHDPEVIRIMCHKVGVLENGKFRVMNMEEFEAYAARLFPELLMKS